VPALVSRSPVQRPGFNTAQGEEAESPLSFLGPGITIRGVLEIDGELVVSGLVRGHIVALRLVIAADGYVEDDIVAREVVANGRLNGRIFAPTVSIEGSAQVEGRVFHTNVMLAQSVRVVGRMPWRPVSYLESQDNLPEARP
jgi:cytoskeletal protein CcmA (bactofilin family)